VSPVSQYCITSSSEVVLGIRGGLGWRRPSGDFSGDRSGVGVETAVLDIGGSGAGMGEAKVKGHVKLAAAMV
jgi:hypothetical protein